MGLAREQLERVAYGLVVSLTGGVRGYRHTQCFQCGGGREVSAIGAVRVVVSHHRSIPGVTGRDAVLVAYRAVSTAVREGEYARMHGDGKGRGTAVPGGRGNERLSARHGRRWLEHVS